jgi:hypothetical protein
MDTITLACAESELAENLYWAHASARFVFDPAPHGRPEATPWDELPAAEQQLWQETAKRLIALHGVRQ